MVKNSFLNQVGDLTKKNIYITFANLLNLTKTLRSYSQSQGSDQEPQSKKCREIKKTKLTRKIKLMGDK